MRATLKPMKAKQSAEPVELLARMRDGKVKVRTAKGDVFAAYRFRLFSEGGKRQLTSAEFDTLPWGGAGRDPLLGALPMKEPA